MSGRTVTFTGENAEEISELGVHVVAHPTQDAIVVFAFNGALDPIGMVLPGQVVTVDERGAFVAGMPETEAPPVPVDLRFDPAKAKVSEVLEYLRNLGDDQAEVDRVLDLERAGKHRRSLVGDKADLDPAPMQPAPSGDEQTKLPAQETEIPAEPDVPDAVPPADDVPAEAAAAESGTDDTAVETDAE